MDTSIKKAYDKIVDYLEHQYGELGDEDKESILILCDFHECEPSALAERIAEDYNMPFKSIYDLL
jgi:hypothetical protein